MNPNELAIELHKKFKGKIEISLRDSSELTKEKLSAYYSPGVGQISKIIAENPNELPNYTWTNNLVAVISDGTAILGLENLGPKAALPVMEGKAMLFKSFANIDSVPIVLNVHTADEIVATVSAIAPSFGAINLEDIAAPICFEVEERLKEALEIPVMHDDQHGTATVVLAGLINAAKCISSDTYETPKKGVTCPETTGDTTNTEQQSLKKLGGSCIRWIWQNMVTSEERFFCFGNSLELRQQ